MRIVYWEVRREMAGWTHQVIYLEIMNEIKKQSQEMGKHYWGLEVCFKEDKP